jgi:hypothetical protein
MPTQVFRREFIRSASFADADDSQRSLEVSLESNNYPKTAESSVELVLKWRYPEKENGNIRIAEIEQRHEPLIARAFARVITDLVRHCETRYALPINAAAIPREFFAEPLKDVRIGFNEAEHKLSGFFFQLPNAKPSFRMKIGDVNTMKKIASAFHELATESE